MSEYDSKELRFPCTYRDCQQRFKTIKDMQRHKKNAPEHDYCKKCDVDCKDWEDLTQHKVTLMDEFWRNRHSYDEETRKQGPPHIVCEFCGEDFKSFGGRKDHRLMMHPADQDLRCPGCEALFTRAGMMVEHLEDGKCPEISALEFKASVLHKHIRTLVVDSGDHFIKKFQANKIIPKKPIKKRLTSTAWPKVGEKVREEGEDASTVTSEDPCSVTDASGTDSTEREDQDEGGVHIDVTLLDRRPGPKGGYPALEAEFDLIDTNPPKIDRSTHEQWPRRPGMKTTSLTKAMRSMSITSSISSIPRTDSVLSSNITSRRGGNKIYTESYPSIGSPDAGVSVTGDDDTASIATTTAVSTASKPVAWTTGQTTKALFKPAKPTPKPGDWDALAKLQENAIMAPSDSKNLMYSRFYDPGAEDYDAELFFNVGLEQYLCPFPACDDQEFDLPSDLADHFKLVHLNIPFVCKVCCKRFNSAKAQVSHMESAGGRCRVKNSNYFKQWLDEITGGFLKAKRLEEPFLYKKNKETAVVPAGRHLVEGVKTVEYKAKLPHQQ